jgi:hypothetical protein
MGKQIKSFRRAFRAEAIQVSLVHMVEHEATQKRNTGHCSPWYKAVSHSEFTRLGLESSKHGNIWAPHQLIYKQYNIIDEET